MVPRDREPQDHAGDRGDGRFTLAAGSPGHFTGLGAANGLCRLECTMTALPDDPRIRGAWLAQRSAELSRHAADVRAYADQVRARALRARRRATRRVAEMLRRPWNHPPGGYQP
jgi:hypothetical protein